jgi:hypothetical protein
MTASWLLGGARTALALQEILQGTAPVGAMSAAIGRPYLFALAQRAAASYRLSTQTPRCTGGK